MQAVAQTPNRNNGFVDRRPQDMTAGSSRVRVITVRKQETLFAGRTLGSLRLLLIDRLPSWQQRSRQSHRKAKKEDSYFSSEELKDQLNL